MITIHDAQTQWRTDRHARARARENFCSVTLDALSRATPVATLPSMEFLIDEVKVDPQPFRQSIDQRNE